MRIFTPTFVPWSPGGLGGKFIAAGESTRFVLALENLMRYLAKNIGVRSLLLHVLFVTIVAVCLAGVSRHSLVLEWSPLVAALVVLIADPLANLDKADAAPTPSRVQEAAATMKILSSPIERVQSTAGSAALISSGA